VVLVPFNGVRSTPYGENPTGYLSYSADGQPRLHQSFCRG
jgi:hypothetical protein